MSKPEYTEIDFQQVVQGSESRLSRNTLSALANAREQALSSQSKWFSEFRGLFSAGVVTAALVVAVLLPMSGNDSSNTPQQIDIADDNLQLLMEDPEFFLWVSSSYSSLSQ